ncbi:MAG TPA: nuclear transport factor 2 family protein [Burkholderiales bacterium]|nr:nuclear transport factor 2 family protein [Burkholderiales bacterium]
MQAASTGAHEARLRELNQDYITSVATSNVRRFEELLADDFLNTNADGSFVDRAQFLKQIARPLTVSNFSCEDVLIRVMGDFAIIHARTKYTKADGQPGVGRYTDIWALRDGRWLCVAAHVMRG